MNVPKLTVAGHPVEIPQGVIINGDLTAFWHNTQREDFLDIYANLDYIFYPGLGNHDYENNVSDCNFTQIPADSGTPIVDPPFPLPHGVGDDNGCAKDAVLFLESYIEDLQFGPSAASLNIAFDLSDHDPDTVAQLTTWNVADPFTTTDSDAAKKNVPKKGSAAYSFDIEDSNFHFIQLKNYPSYTNTFKEIQVAEIIDVESNCRNVEQNCKNVIKVIPGLPDEIERVCDLVRVCDLIPALKAPAVALHYPSVKITSSLPWLLQDLNAATAAGKYSVINVHELGPTLDDPDFLNVVSGQNVVAIFGGHIHQNFGYLQTLPNGGGYKIPVFISGSAECETFLAVEFQPRYINFAVVDSFPRTLSGLPRFVKPPFTGIPCDSRGVFGVGNDAIDYGKNDAKAAPGIVVINAPPTRVQSLSPRVNASEGFAVSFSADGDDPDDDPLAFTWRFGDGTSATGESLTKDELGNVIGQEIDIILVGLELHLEASFADADTLDTHTVEIDWGDATADGGPATSPVSGKHTYFTPGALVVRVTATDDDTGNATASRTISVVDGAGAVTNMAEKLREIAKEPTLGPQVAQALRAAVDKLIGNHPRLGTIGANDRFENGNPDAALMLLAQTIELLLAPNLPSNIGLQPLVSQLVLAAKATALQVLRLAHANDPAGSTLPYIGRAQWHVDTGNQRLERGESVGAVDGYRSALAVTPRYG